MTPEESIEALNARIRVLEQHAVEATKVAQRLVGCVERLQAKHVELDKTVAALITAVGQRLVGKS
jgi:hypothetical protein